MKIAILTDRISFSYEEKRLREEIKNFNNIEILSSDNLEFPEYNIDLSYDIYYFFRFELGNITKNDILLLARKLLENGKIIINKDTPYVESFDKIYIYQNLYKNGINIPKTIRALKIRLEDNYEYIIKKLDFPMVVKHPNMHRGKFVFLLKDEKDLLNFLARYRKYIPVFLFQKYINYVKDIRVIFIGEPIGAMQRIAEKGFKANISQGGIGKKHELDDELKELSYKISEIFNIQIFAFDVLIDKEDKKYVIDLHKTFQFKGFEKYLNINVARKILEYLNEIKN